MCKYCEQDESIFYDREGSEGGIREVVIEQDGTLSVSSNNFDRKEADRLEKLGFTFGESARYTKYDVSIKINYCPMCGRKLVSESELIPKTYEDGLNDAWELARKIALEEEMGGICFDDFKKIFGVGGYVRVLKNMTPQQALAKIEAYEKSQQIQVGDVVRFKDSKTEVLITSVARELNGIHIQTDECGKVGEVNSGICREHVEKTGKHLDISHLLEQIRGDS